MDREKNYEEIIKEIIKLLEKREANEILKQIKDMDENGISIKERLVAILEILKSRWVSVPLLRERTSELLGQESSTIEWRFEESIEEDNIQLKFDCQKEQLVKMGEKLDSIISYVREEVHINE